jgi:signal transduction histidine kinase
MQDMQQGARYEKAADRLGDTLLSETIRRNSMDLEKKYETEKKEVRIVQLEDEKKLQQLTIRHQHTLNYVLIGGGVFLLTLFGLSYRNYQQKQKLHHQRIQELETEKKLEATEAVLKGEEQERARLAKDLHDGLGGMLSGIKYSFNTMKGNLIMTPENQQAFDRSMDMLDSSIKEMRRVAHNMMPEALVKFGLDAALKDYCNDIDGSGALHVSYQSYGLEQAEIDQTMAITLYRIVQELVNNALKHAAAKTAIVQVTKTGQTISVTVEDDGKGFDPAISDRSGGIGWSNIRNRVEFLKGKLDIRSEADKGTSVHIEINNA